MTLFSEPVPVPDPDPEPSPDAARWARIKGVFDATVELTAAERDARISTAGLDEAAAAELRSLLAHYDAATRDQVFMAETAAQQLVESAAQNGQRLGAWQIVRPIGAGGMGEVFEARRADGSYEGRAAVKLLKRGMDSAAVLQRFAQERQALARLSHPHIARLLDAGASQEGLPYFVLEYVDGQPIDEAVRGLRLDARLQLFLQLADAVAYAHRNLLVHRDLKPGNVLVDTVGQVKLLDFGIAKALDPLEGPGGPEGHTTVAGQRPYTPHYASPEQVRGEPVSTATDIYSLGVLLYQMLTGARPTGRKAVTPAEAARSVLEEQPARPSRLSPTEAIDPQWLQTRRKLEGDLDNILLKALEKLPERRYATVDALAADVGHYLAGRPVSARQPSVAYLVSKFVRRQPWAVAAGGLGLLGLAIGAAAVLAQGQLLAALSLLALAVGLGLALVQQRQAAMARDLAQGHLQATRTIVGEVLTRHADAVHRLPGGLALKSSLLQDMIRHLDALAAQAGDDRAFTGELAQAHARLADVQGNVSGLSLDEQSEARRHAQKALALFKQAGLARASLPMRLWQAQVHYTLGRLDRAQGDPAAALQHFDDGLAVLQSAPASMAHDDKLRMAIINGLADGGQTLDATGMPQLDREAEALKRVQQSCTLMEALKSSRQVPEDAFVLARLNNILAVIHEKHRRLEDAHRHCARAAELLTENLAAQDQPDTSRQLTCVLVLHNLSHLRTGLGRPEDACLASEQAVDLVQRLMRENPVTDGMRLREALVRHGWVSALLQAGQPAQALAQLPPVLAWCEAQVERTEAQDRPVAHRRWASALVDQGSALHSLGRVEEAQAIAAQAHGLLHALVIAPEPERDALELWADVLHLQWTLRRNPAAREAALQAHEHLAGLAPLNAWRSAQLSRLQAGC